MLLARRILPMTLSLAGVLLAAGRPTVAQSSKTAAPRATAPNRTAPRTTAPKSQAAAPGTAKVDVLVLRVARPLPGTPVKYDILAVPDPLSREVEFAGPPGTQVMLLITRPDRNFIEFDAKASKLLGAADDKKTDLAKPTGGIPVEYTLPGGEQTPFHGSVGADGHRSVVDVRIPGVPVPGASRITMKADLVLKCGSDLKTVEQKGFQPRPGSKITVGPMPMTVTEGYGGTGLGAAEFGPGGIKGQMSIWLSQARSAPSIKELAFLDDTGTPIKSWIASPQTAFGLDQQLQTQYGLDRKVDHLTARITYYNKIEPLTVPVAVEVGVGF